MELPKIAVALEKLRSAADTVKRGFPTTTWKRIAGPGPDELVLEASNFKGLTLQPATVLVLRCELNLPAEAHGVALAGQPLEAVLTSIYPADIRFDGKSVFKETGVPVAAGPALFTVTPELKEGANGTLEINLLMPNQQMYRWFRLTLTTPTLRARFEKLDIAWARLAMADAVAKTPEERAVVARAAELVPLIVETKLDAKLDPLLADLATILSPLNPRIEAINVHLVGHSHIDMIWLWTWADTVEVIKRDLRSVLSLMRDYPELTFSHSQPASYEVFREEEPELFEEMLAHVRSGRWEPLGMQWVEPDANMPSGEAHARQLLESVRWNREVLGISPTTFHSPDTFGMPGNLPQIASSGGAVRCYHHRCNPGGVDLWPAYWWHGQDGTRMLATSTHTYNGDITAGEIAIAAMRAAKHGQPAGLHFHGIGDHGGGPARQNLDALRRLQKMGGLPKAFCSTLAAYARQIVDSGVKLPEHRGELNFAFEGCYTTHADTKRFNRQGENLLMTADTLSALAGLNRNAALAEAWKRVLFNQFHDILAGSSIREGYADQAKEMPEIQAAGQAVIEESLKVLQRGVAGGRIAVTNPLGFDREDWVTVAWRGETAHAPVLRGCNGHVTSGQWTQEGLGFVAKVPAFGTVSYEVGAAERVTTTGDCRPAYAPADPRVANVLADPATEPPYLRIETAYFVAYVRRDCGIITSLLDKRVGRELVGFGMRRAADYQDTARVDLALGVLQIIDEYPHKMSAWHLDEVHTEHSLLRGGTSSVVESGPVRWVIQTEHKVRSSSIVQRIIFYADLPRIDFQTSIDWQEIGGPEAGVPNMKVAFTARLDECEAWFETPFAATRRPADGQEAPALRWADVGGKEYGIAILNDSKYGCDALGTRLRMTLVRSGYDPDAVSDVGRHEVRYSFVPHPGNWREARIVQSAAGFNQPLLARAIQSPSAGDAPQPWPRIGGSPSVQIACIKTAHDGRGRVIRLYESGGEAGSVKLQGIPPGASVTETNIVEDALRSLPVNNGEVELAFTPWQIRTVVLL